MPTLSTVVRHSVGVGWGLVMPTLSTVVRHSVGVGWGLVMPTLSTVVRHSVGVGASHAYTVYCSQTFCRGGG